MAETHISVAMACYNGGKFILDQLESIVNQSRPPSEIVICDDLSSDDTQNLVRSFKTKIKITFVVNPVRLGPVKNFEKAISLCTGDYIALSDQDDVWYPSKLEESLKIIRAIEHDLKIPCLVFTDLELVDEHLHCINMSLWNNIRVNPVKNSFKKMLYFNPISGCTMLFNRALKSHLKEIPHCAVMHDSWIALVAYAIGNVGILYKPTVKYRQHSNNVTLNFERTIWNRFVFFLRELAFQRKQYMHAELRQAERFFLMFKDFLKPNDLDSLLMFIKLKKSSFLLKKLARYAVRHF